MRRRVVVVVALLGLADTGCSGLKSPTGDPESIRLEGREIGPGNAQAHLAVTEKQVRELTDRLADREQEIAAARVEILSLRAQSVRPDRHPSETAAPQLEPRNVGDSLTGDTPSAADPSPAAVDSETERALRAEVERTSIALASVEAQLHRERRRRKVLEQDLASLRDETSTNPFQRQQGVDLSGAQEEIARLQRELTAEREEREEIARRYETLDSELRAVRMGRNDSGENPTVHEIEQERALAELRNELAASRAAEQELRSALDARGTEGASTSPASARILEAENLALQSRLADERRRNEDLAMKLKTAMRVTDLIFKMQGAEVPGNRTETQP
jgi:hypothetical protein